MNSPKGTYRLGMLAIANVLGLAVSGVESGLSQAASDILSPTQTYDAGEPFTQRLGAGSLHGENWGRGANCSAFVPPDATTANGFQLCQSDHGGKNELYACQDFATQNEHYRVFFKGGRHPKAIATVTGNSGIKKILWLDEMQADRPVCNFPPPIEIPAAARFIGAGVCLDESENSVPCALFNHKAAQLESVANYMVFYDAQETSPGYVLIFKGINENAMLGELAYQLGLSLAKTHCCQRLGLQYIEYARQSGHAAPP
jgi:hypothetical protein